LLTHIGDGQRFVVHGAEKVTAFLEVESAIRAAKTEIQRKGLYRADFRSI